VFLFYHFHCFLLFLFFLHTSTWFKDNPEKTNAKRTLLSYFSRALDEKLNHSWWTTPQSVIAVYIRLLGFRVPR
jgi:hypothetical protein